MYETLDSEKIVATLDQLERRIGERFPASGLWRVTGDLKGIARETSGRITKIAQPNVTIRLAVSAIGIFAVAWMTWLVTMAVDLKAEAELMNVMQGIDAGVSLLIVLGGAALFLSTLERRWRQDQALKALHEFRSIVHVIDMHQLTKDPAAFGAPRTSSSPERPMSVYQLLRYLGYCSELLSLAGKVAALYADKIRDPVVVDAVGDIERLTTDLSQKIWQKIELVQERMPHRPASDALGPGPHA